MKLTRRNEFEICEFGIISIWAICFWISFLANGKNFYRGKNFHKTVVTKKLSKGIFRGLNFSSG